MNDREPLALMTGTERAAYCAWLLKLASDRRGSVPDYLRNSSRELSGRFI